MIRAQPRLFAPMTARVSSIVQVRPRAAAHPARTSCHQISESTIKVSLREEGTAAPEPANTEDVRNPSLGISWHRGVQGFLRVIGGVVVGLGYLVPILLVALIVWFTVKRVRRSPAPS